MKFGLIRFLKVFSLSLSVGFLYTSTQVNGAQAQVPVSNNQTSSTAAPLEGKAVHHEAVSKKPSKEELLKGASTVVSRSGKSWSMYLQNSCHTGMVSLGKNFQPLGKLKWTFPAEGPIDSSPAIYKGVVYVGSDDFHVYAVDERNGRMLWKTKLGDKVKSSPAVNDEVLVIGCEDHKVYGLDPKSGKILWSVQTGDRVNSSPAILNGIAYFGGWDGFVYAVDVKSGTIKWNYPRGKAKPGEIGGGIGRITASPAVIPGMVIIPSHTGSVYALSTRDGSLLWKYKTKGKILGSPLIMKGLVYFGSWDKKLYAIDLHTAALRWKFSGQDSFSITPSGAAGRIFAGNDDKIMYCLNATSGKIYWKQNIYSPVPLLSSSPAVAGNRMYCGSPDCRLYAIDIRNGGIKWRYKTQRPIISTPAISNSGICVGSQDGNLYMIN